MNDIGPIFRALLHNKLGALLIALQIALTLAIVTNAAFIIQQRSADIARPTGVDEANSAALFTTVYDMQLDQHQLIRDDLEALRAIPGVVAVSPTNSFPASNSGWGEDLYNDPEMPSNETITFGKFMVDEHGLEAFGLELVAGRNLQPEDMVTRSMGEFGESKVMLVSQALADELFPDGDALGKTVWDEPDGKSPIRIVGIYDKMQHAWPTASSIERSALTPELLLFGSPTYMLRAEPGRLGEAMKTAEKYLSGTPGRLVGAIRTFEENKRRTYSGDIAMVKLLTAVITVLAGITGLGIVGLAWFSVTQRRKQIGTRRALGATRWNVMRYFMIEIGMISAAGLTLGLVGTVALNWFLDTNYEVGRMPLWYLPAGIAAMWLIGQLAVLEPARRASNIPPAIATRSV